MARVKFSVKSKNNPSNIYVRFYHSRDFDINSKTGFIIDPKLWSQKQQRVKTTSTSRFDQIINPKLTSLKEEIIYHYNLSYNAGEKINKHWLDKIVFNFNNQPMNEDENPKFYLIPFFENYIEESKQRVNPQTNKVINPKTISKYKTTLERLKDFESYSSSKLRFREIDLNFHKSFVNYLVSQWYYNGTTIQKNLNIIKGVCKEAKMKGFQVSEEVEHRNFTAKREMTYDTYLNENEIEKIFHLKFEKYSELDVVRDWTIIGVWTGLRVSDIKRLSKVNLRKDFIEITTTKTGANAIIPIHQQVKSILDKRDGNFPRKITEQYFNEKINKIAAKADIDNILQGKKMQPVTLPNGQEVYRKKLDFYTKNELITTHTCRRSFATNLYGKLPNRTIMAITTHTSEAQFEKYIKQSQMEHVKALEDFWSSEGSN